MKNKMTKGIILACITSLVIACNPKKEDAAAPTVDNAKIKAELQAMETVMADAYNMRSAASEEYYAEDATSFSQNKAPLVGKLAIDKSMKEDLATFPEGNKISFSANEIFPSSDGNQVVEIGSYKVVDAKNAVQHAGNYMSLFVKKDGKYVCIRDMGASDMPKADTK
jgi:ketosteroid isomerase-like protein